jgi:hypothetical protein|tara:strand:- start:212 stop:562 length:351 start_codon:yes stop_codon:yes gene_type:complete
MNATWYQGPIDYDTTIDPTAEWYPWPAEWEIAECIAAEEPTACPRCRHKTDFIEIAYIHGQPRELCIHCIDLLKAQPRPRPPRLRLRDRAIAPQINRRLMPCNRLGPDATYGRKTQ